MSEIKNFIIHVDIIIVMNLIFFNDEKGEPHGGFPEPLRSKILKGLSPISGRPGQHLAPLNFIQLKDELIEKHCVGKK